MINNFGPLKVGIYAPGAGKTSLTEALCKKLSKKSQWLLFLMIFIQLRMQNIL